MPTFGQLLNTERNNPSMQKLLNIAQAFGFILTIMLMIFGYGVMFLSSAFLDATPHTNPKSTEVDHGATKVWNGNA
ncbi:hypothetical protein ACFWDG_16875 [Peribacillus sp. NPDC060186]